jgi:BirA family biotin operon repressor/biotin-[acetyl-CoA-carboxylase] ligase
MTAVLRLPPRPDGSALALAGLVAGVAALEAARNLGADKAMLKWPNDVVVGERKLCGILIEADDVAGPSPLVLAGFGLNCASRAGLGLPKDLEDRYVGLADVSARNDAAAVEPAQNALLAALGAWYDRWTARGAGVVLEAWRKADSLRGAEVRADARGGVVTGRADGVSEAGALRVVTAKGVVEVTAGDVKRVRPAR